MKKYLVTILLLSGVNASAINWAPINGSCQIGDEVQTVSFPSGNGSAFPVYKNKTIMLSIFAGPADSVSTDENGANLISVVIGASDKKGNGLGTTHLRNLTANPKVARELAFDLSDGTIVNCKF